MFKKKTLAIIAIVVILLVLLTPVRMHLKDGGSVSYKSLLYEVTKIHQLLPNMDGEKPFIDGLEIKILGMRIYRKTDENLNKQNTPQIETDFDTPILVHTDNQQVEPYVVILTAKMWSEYGWVMGDMPNIFDLISKNSSLLPEIVYNDDFTVFYKDRNISFVSASVYNEAFEPVLENAELQALKDISAGTYYFGISVKEQGEYIEAEKEYETTVYGCLYKLVK